MFIDYMTPHPNILKIIPNGISDLRRKQLYGETVWNPKALEEKAKVRLSA
jgi:hypothetical protein